MRLPARRRLDHAASLTAQFNAAQRAAESMQPSARRLLDDPYSRHFAGRYKPLLITPLVARSALLLALSRWWAGPPRVVWLDRWGEHRSGVV